MVVTTVVGVPHPAPDERALHQAVNARLDGPDPPLLVAGRAAVELGGDGAGVGFEVAGHDPAMVPAFAAAGRGRMTEAEIARVGEHGTCAYVVADDGGTIETATRVLRAARAVVLAGGLGVKVESSGVAHSPERWLSFGRDPDPHDLVAAFVAVVRHPEGWTRTCGLHALGWPEASAPVGDDPAAAVDLVLTLAHHLVGDEPVLETGQTFGVAPGARAHRLTLEPDAYAPPDDLFHNPFGVWTLRPA